MNEDRADPESWLARALESALELGLLAPAHLLAHATPEVLAERLPRALMVKVFASAFSTGRLTPEGLLAAAPVTTLTRHLPAAVLWEAMRAGAARSGLCEAPSDQRAPEGSPRRWLTAALASGIDCGVLGAAEVMRCLPPSLWVGVVPRSVLAELLALGLARDTFRPQLMLEVLRPEVIVEHLPARQAWAILDDGAHRAFGLARI